MFSKDDVTGPPNHTLLTGLPSQVSDIADPLSRDLSTPESYGRTMTTDTLRTFRQSLAAVDPATLTGADKRAMIDLLKATLPFDRSGQPG
jgi:hypothetical protein